MDDLRGDQAVWRFDGETVAIRYETQGWFKDPLLKRIGQLELPVGAVAEVDFRPGAGRRRGWILQLRLRNRTDPYAAVGAMLKEKSQPFRLTGPASGELVAEYLADQIRFAAEQYTEPPAPDTATRLVPRPPLHIQTSEGTATMDGDSVRLVWSGGEASGRKRKAQRREYAVADLAGAEWVPSDDWEWGYLRLVTTSGGESPAKPRHDLNVLVADEGSESYDTLLMAATVTAHVWARAETGSGGREGRNTVARFRDPRWWLDTAARSVDQLRALPTGSGAEDSGPADSEPADSEPADSGPAAPETGTAAGEVAGPGDTEWIFRQIERLGELHTRGLLTDEEFSAKKAELLDRI